MSNNTIEILRILREPPLGRLTLEADGTHYRQINDINSPVLRQRVMAAVADLISFVGGYEVLSDAGLAPPLQPLDSKKPAEILTQQQEAFLNSLQQAVPREASQTVEVATKATQPTAVSPTNSSDLIAQIDAILQRLVANDPRLAGRSIHLEQAPQGGLHIAVDGQRYQQPGEIPDRPVQLAIKMALKEWESR